MSRSLAQTAQTVRRIRYGEVGFDGKDVKVVWHQGSNFDLVTQVDTDGCAIEQEIAFGKDIVTWHRERPLRTGTIVAEADTDKGHAINARAGIINLDPMPRLELLKECAELAELVPGDDRYLQHIAAQLRAAIDGVCLFGSEVTNVVVIPGTADVAQPRSDAGLPRLLRRLLGK